MGWNAQAHVDCKVSDPVSMVVAMLQATQARHAVVLQGDRPVGIITDRQLAMRIRADPATDPPVGALMTFRRQLARAGATGPLHAHAR